MTRPVILCVLLLLPAVACIHRPCRNGLPVLDPSPCRESFEPAEASRRALVSWLECNDCPDSDVFKLKPFGQSLMPLLNLAVLEGPSRASEELVRSGLSTRWDEMREYAATHPESDIPGTREQFVSLYQIRAGLALVVVAGPAARSVLIEAVRRAEREDVRKSLQQYLAQMQ